MDNLGYLTCKKKPGTIIKGKPGELEIHMCVLCCGYNHNNGNTLPFMCPQTGLPCFALDPDRMIPDIDYGTMDDCLLPDNRLAMDCRMMSEEFVRTMISTYEDVKDKYAIPELHY